MAAESFHGFTLVSGEIGEPQVPILKCTKTLASGSVKKIFYRTFTSPAELIDFATKWKLKTEKLLLAIAEEKAARAKMRLALVNPFNVGDILSEACDNDQTGIAFFEVTDIKPRSVSLREIKVSSHGHEYVLPVKGCFEREPFSKALQMDIYGKPYLAGRSRPIVKAKMGVLNTNHIHSN